jgi:hypothetical protein
VSAAHLSREDSARPWRLIEEAPIHESVVDDDVGPAQELEAADRDQPRVAGASADERDRPPARVGVIAAWAWQCEAAGRPTPEASLRESAPPSGGVETGLPRLSPMG